MSLPEHVLVELNAALKRDATLRKLKIAKVQDYVPNIKKWYFHRPSELRSKELDDELMRRDHAIAEAVEAIRYSRRRISAAKSHFKHYRYKEIRKISRSWKKTSKKTHLWRIGIESIEVIRGIFREQAKLYRYMFEEYQFFKPARKENNTWAKLRFWLYERREQREIRREREAERQKREQRSCQVFRFDEYAERKKR